MSQMPHSLSLAGRSRAPDSRADHPLGRSRLGVRTLLVLAVLVALVCAGFAAAPATAQPTQAAQTPGAVNLTLDPSPDAGPGVGTDPATLRVNDTQTYAVVVEDPDAGILGYNDLAVTVDPAVAELVAFEPNHTSNFSLSEIHNDGARLSLAAATTDDFKQPAPNYTLVEFTLQATAPGTTPVSFAAANATITDYNDTAYNIQRTTNATLTVKQPPTFAVRNVTPADATVQNGTTLNLSATIENTGDVRGTQPVALTIDGRTTTQQVTLNASHTQTVTFQNVDTAPLGVGTYIPTVASANDSATGTLTVNQPPTPTVSALDIATQGTEATVIAGESVNATVTVANVGDNPGAFDVTLAIGTTVTETQTTTQLDAGANETVTFEVGTDSLPVVTGGYEAVVTAGHSAVAGRLFVSVDITGNSQPAADTTGDGLLNDVRGDGTFDIFDVQTLFTNLNTPAVQNNAALFNFQGATADEVTVFDVQALFTTV